MFHNRNLEQLISFTIVKMGDHSTNCCLLQNSFPCGENWHDPVKCKWLRKWIKKCDDDSETSNWIAANTKVS
jgi:hypothetical protein